MNCSDDQWTTQVNTLSRDGAIKVCTIIARAIESERITSGKTKIFILGGAGKSLVVDAISQDLSDAHTAFKMSDKRFVEGGPSKALRGKFGRKIVKGIQHKKNSCVVTFCHLSGIHRKSWLENIASKYVPSRNVGVDFMTEIDEGFNEIFIPDISIKFYPNSSNEIEKGWGRSWTITIDNHELKTNSMKRAFEQLKRYELNRKRRRASKIKVCG